MLMKMKIIKQRLNLELNPDKVFIKTLNSSVDFLGWVHFPNYRVLRNSSKRRMFRRLNEKRTKQTIASYLGLLKHGTTFKLTKRVLEYNTSDENYTS